MTLPFAAIDAIFSRRRGAAAILFLLEDSSYMAPLWQHLRDSYIPSFLTTIKNANPSAPAKALWMTTLENTPFEPPFDDWDDIPTINFSTCSRNTISPASVSCAIEALSGTFGHEPATRHLIIVAALNPSMDILGPHGTLVWSTAVERLHQKEIQVHLIIRSQSMMDSLMPLYWGLIGKDHVYQSFADDTQFAFYLSDSHNTIDKEKGLAVANSRRVPNSGLRSTTSNDDSASSIDKLSLVYQIQKMNGMEKKRRSRTRRDQPTANKPGQPYQKSSPHTRTNSSTAQPTPSDLSGCSPPRRKDTSHVSKIEAPSYSGPLPSSSDEYRLPYSLATSPSHSSSPSSYPDVGTSFSSPGSGNISPLRASLPIPALAPDHFQHVTLTPQSTTPDSLSLSPSSPSYHEPQSYSRGLPGDLGLQYPVSQAISVDGSRLTTTEFNDIYGPNHSYWNAYDRQQGRSESPVHPRSLASYPPATGKPGGSHFYSGHGDHTVGTSSQNIYLLASCSSMVDSSITFPYYP